MKFRFPGYIYFFSLMAALLCLTGCIKNEFRIDFKLDTSINTTTRIVYYASDKRGGIVLESAVAIAAGKGELQGITKLPCVVWVYDNRAQLPACAIFAERGDKIKVSGSEASPLSWEVDGNKINRLLTEWRIENRSLLQKAISSISKEDDAPRKKLNEAIEKFVDSHQDSPASIILLTGWFDAKISPEKYDFLVKLLTDSGVMDKYPSLQGRIDLFSPSESIGATSSSSLKDIVVRSVPKGADTLRLSSGKHPSIIYIWHNDDPSRRSDIDSLNRLVKWRGDSSRFLITDISLEPDSAIWVFALHNDTLSKTVRAWMPRGEADPDLMRLGVTSTPYWIVTSAKGKQEYSGGNAAKALSTLRKLMTPPNPSPKGSDSNRVKAKPINP